MDERAGKNVTVDSTLEIIRIILELHSQIPKSVPDADIMRIIAASKSVDYSAPVPILRPNNGWYPHYWICERGN